MKKIDEIKNFLEIKELSTLEKGTIQGGSMEAEAKQKQKNRQKNDGDGTIGGPQA